MEVRKHDRITLIALSSLLQYLTETYFLIFISIIIIIRYDSFVNYEFWPSIHMPVLVYFKENQTSEVRNSSNQLFLYWLCYVPIYSNFVISPPSFLGKMEYWTRWIWSASRYWNGTLFPWICQFLSVG